MRALKPTRIGRFRYCTGSKSKCVYRRLRLRGKEFAAVELDKPGRQHEPGALVAVDKRMIAHDAYRVRCRQFSEARRTVMARLPRTRQGSGEHRCVADTSGSAIVGQHPVVERKHLRLREPADLSHLANSLRAFR